MPCTGWSPPALLALLAAAAAVAVAIPALSHEHGDHASHAAYGQPGDPAKVSRSIAINMDDSMHYTPSRISVRRGETIRFVVRNSGRLEHEIVLGGADELRQHAAMMREHPAMIHTESNALMVDPGKTGELVWRFTQPGTVDFACLQPGHFEAGMRGQITVK